MATDYDDIAEEYKESKLQPWRTHIEQYTLLQLVGDVTGKTVVDLACGEGYYTRLLKRRGANRITGVDLSQRMIDLAKAEEARETMGIDYVVSDARAIDMREQCDVAFAAYLLNYAQNFDELLQMCRAVARALKPGGRFITANNHPADAPANFDTGRRYGFSKQLEGELVEGAPIVWTFYLPEGPFDLTNYYLSPETMDKALREAGLRDVRWHGPKVSPDGLKEWGEQHWMPFLKCPPVAFIECVK